MSKDAFPLIGRVHVGSKRESNGLKKKESAFAHNLTFEDWPENNHHSTPKYFPIKSNHLHHFPTNYRRIY